MVSKSLNLIGCKYDIKDIFVEKQPKLFFSETIWGISLILCIQLNDIRPYINCVLHVCSDHITCSDSYCKKGAQFIVSYNDLDIQVHIFSLLLSA